MSAKQVIATSSRFCFLLEVDGWEPVVYTDFKMAYELMRLTALTFSDTLDKTKEEVEAELNSAQRKSIVHEIHKPMGGEPFKTKGLYTIRKLSFIDLEVAK